MQRELTLYISAGPEMAAECELLGRVLARMPKGLKWVIKRTPGPFEDGTPDMAALATSQFYLILLGMDIHAPMGVEFSVAQDASAFIMAYRSGQSPPSPAAAYFASNARIRWDWYRSPQELAGLFERALVDQLIAGTPGYGLELPDLEELLSRQRELADKDGVSEEQADDRRGAGHGGVILADA